MNNHTAATGSIAIPDWGYDHLVLADWRTSVLRLQPRDTHGQQPATVTTGYRSPGGIDLSVELERGAATDFPTTQDDDVLLGLIYLAHEQGFPDIVRFVPNQLARIIRWPGNEYYYTRIATALDRYKKLSATFRHNWYSKQDRAIKLQLMTGVIAQAEVVTRRGRRAKNEVPESHVQWTENFSASLREGNVLPINFAVLFSLSRPAAKQLYRQLNKTWRGGLKPFLYERDLREIACGHLGMRDSKYLKRNFHYVVRELEQKGYLTQMSERDRYRQIAQSIWRVSFVLHPNHYARRAKSVNAAPIEHIASTSAHQVVCAYHEARFGRTDYRPKPRELVHAQELITRFGAEPVVMMTKPVAQLVRTQQQNDLYFGFAVPYYRKLLESPEASHGFRKRSTAGSDTAAIEQDRVERTLELRRAEHMKLLVVWQAADARDRDRYRETALRRAESETVRRRIRQSTPNEPSHEVLQELALAIGGGKS